MIYARCTFSCRVSTDLIAHESCLACVPAAQGTRFYFNAKIIFFLLDRSRGRLWDRCRRIGGGLSRRLWRGSIRLCLVLGLCWFDCCRGCFGLLCLGGWLYIGVTDDLHTSLGRSVNEIRDFGHCEPFITGMFINSSKSRTGLLVSEQQDHDLRPSWKTYIVD